MEDAVWKMLYGRCCMQDAVCKMQDMMVKSIVCEDVVERWWERGQVSRFTRCMRC
jgi:hypothetical protein